MGLSLRKEALALVDLIALTQRVADGMTLRREEREAHASTDHERIDGVEQRVDHAELVGHLRAAEHGDEGASRVLAQTEQHVDLLGQQPARGARKSLWRTDDRRMGAVRRAERVVHVGVEAGDQPIDERRVVRLFARVVPEVLDELDAWCQLGQPLAHRRHGIGRIRLAFRPSEVRAHRDVRAVLLQPLDRRQRRPDAQVVGDAAVLHRHVEVRAQQHPLPLETRQVFEDRDLRRHYWLARPMMIDMSTRRFE